MDEVQTEQLAHETPWWGRWLLGAFIGLVACGYVAQGVFATWKDTHPARLLALSSRVRYLLLVVDEGIEPTSYALVAFGRLALAALVCYGIGKAFGDRILQVFRYLGMSWESIHKMRDGFGTASWVLVPFFVGSNLICALAGVVGMPFKRWFALLSFGIVARLVLYWYLADWFDGILGPTNDFISKYSRPVTIGSVALMFVMIGRNVKNARD